MPTKKLITPCPVLVFCAVLMVAAREIWMARLRPLGLLLLGLATFSINPTFRSSAKVEGQQKYTVKDLNQRGDLSLINQRGDLSLI
jgi:hypothetical protein